VWNESRHHIEYYSIDCVGNKEDTHNQTFYVDNLDPIVKITNPVGVDERGEYDGFYYRPGYVFDPQFGTGLNYTERTGDEICYYTWSFRIPGNDTWITIEEGCGDGQQVKWDTYNWRDILEPYICCDEPRPVLVKLKIWDEHCRNDTHIVQIYFCREINPKPCVQDIDIMDGWNLISIAVGLDSLGTTYNASILAAEINSQAGENIVKYVVWYEKATNQFHEYVVDSDVGFDFSINKGQGYYVYAITGGFDSEFIIVGDCAECETVDLGICWNLVGWNSMYSLSVDDFAMRINQLGYEQYGIQGDYVQAIVKHVGGGNYQAWYPWDTTVWDLETDNAYWIFVSMPIDGVFFDFEPVDC
jgi:hypothetical protein